VCNSDISITFFFVSAFPLLAQRLVRVLLSSGQIEERGDG
jgi:hypothetical protein